MYANHPDYGGEVDHAELVDRMCAEYDGWVLHTASPTLKHVLAVCPDDTRLGAWVKPWCVFKRNVMVAYAWEPVLFWGGRPRDKGLPTMRDFIIEAAPMRRGFTGVKPDAVCRWAFDVLGMTPDDELRDLFPGSGAVTRAWEAWRSAPALPRLDFIEGGAKQEATGALFDEDAA